MDISRRGLLKRMGQSGLGLGSATLMASAVSEGISIVDEGREALEQELKSLQAQLNQLDGRTKLVLKLLAVSVGLDLVSDLAVVTLKSPV